MDGVGARIANSRNYASTRGAQRNTVRRIEYGQGREVAGSVWGAEKEILEAACPMLRFPQRVEHADGGGAATDCTIQTRRSNQRFAETFDERSTPAPAWTISGYCAEFRVTPLVYTPR